MQTLKFKINHDFKDEITVYQKQYSSLVHVCFEFLKNEPRLKSLFEYKIKDNDLMKTIESLNNINLMNNWFKQCSISEAYQLVNSFKLKQDEFKEKLERRIELQSKDKLLKGEKKELKKLNKIKEPKLIFGGRKLFSDRCKNLISKDEFNQRRLSHLYSIGTAKPYKGNQKFRIHEDLNKVIFQPDRKNHFELNLVGVSDGYKKILKKLFLHQENKDLPITYKLSTEYIYISFEEDTLYKDEFNFKKIKDRYCALDLNPNYIGYSIIDWKSSNKFKIIDSGVYSFKELNNLYRNESLVSTDKKNIYKNNKRNFEVIEVAKNLINKCCYYKIENFIVEDLNIKCKDRGLGKNFNKLVHNSWIRNRFLNNIQKRCKIFNINYLEVLPQYSSFVGNLVFRYLNLPDMVLSSIEISRRGYEFRHQFILKDKPQIKNIVKIDINNDEVFKEHFRESLEEFSVNVSFKDIVEAYWHFKRNSGLLYRVSLDSFSSCFRLFSSRQSRLLLYKHFK